MAIAAYVRHQPLLVGVVLIFVLLSGLAFLAHMELHSIRSQAYQVTVDGVPIAYVDSPETAFMAVQIIQEDETNWRGYAVLIDNRVVTEPVTIDPDEPRLTAEELAVELAKNVDFVARGVAVLVDSEPVVVLPDEDDAQATVESLIEEYRRRLEQGEFPAPGKNRIAEEIVVNSVEPVEEIGYETVKVDPSEVKTAAGASDVLIRGSEEVVFHTVQSGESLWTIAQHNNISVAELEQANPHVDNPHRLQPGDRLNLKVPTPYITLKSVETRYFIEQIPFETKVEEDPSRYPWEQYVKQAGEYGEREVVERVERIWGQITKTETVSEKVIKEPTPQIVVRGTKKVPEGGTGNFIWPVNGGRISDRFGWSSWRGRHHDGIDIPRPRGTTVRAVDGGVVTTAGWKNGLGQTVIISHGGNLSTVYAHLDSISVKKGQTVHQGQPVGTVGCTGFCTGPHLHLEVLVNGRPVDPLRYLK